MEGYALMLETTPAELVKALAIYKERYGGLASLETEQLDTIIKEIQVDSKRTPKQKRKNNRRNNVS